jgi:prepilin-type N-terminal cleavage/methylation domain-containing protein
MACPARQSGFVKHRLALAGFTLIELTVVLAVIVTLALILTPSIANFINDSRVARAQSDCQTIASAVVQFYRDNGFFPQWKLANKGGPGQIQDQVALLVSGGNIPTELTPTQWSTGSSGLLTDQLMTNTPAYTLRTPTAQFGWNGPYLSSDIGSDPWNNRYMVNVGLIDTSVGAVGLSGVPKNAVWVISAGPNGTIETPFSQIVTAATRGGDDIAIRIQ